MSTDSEPRKPAIGIDKWLKKVGKDEPTITVMATNREAPELTPKMYGPARVFLNNCCKINPETAKATPHAVAVNNAGNRKE